MRTSGNPGKRPVFKKNDGWKVWGIDLRGCLREIHGVRPPFGPPGRQAGAKVCAQEDFPTGGAGRGGVRLGAVISQG